MRSNKMSLGALMALFVLVAGASFALGPQEKPPDPPQPPPPPAETAETNPDGDDPKAPKRFVPTQKTSADNNATFPVDI